MRLGVVGNLITHAGFQHKLPSILKLSMQFTLKAEQDVAFHAPVVGKIAGRILKHTNAN